MWVLIGAAGEAAPGTYVGANRALSYIGVLSATVAVRFVENAAPLYFARDEIFETREAAEQAAALKVIGGRT